MERDSLKPKQALILEFEPRRRNTQVLFEVRADRRVATYLVDDAGMEDFKEGETPEYYVGRENRRFHQANLTLPDYSRYYLIIQNQSPDKPARIEYNLKVR